MLNVLKVLVRLVYTRAIIFKHIFAKYKLPVSDNFSHFRSSYVIFLMQGIYNWCGKSVVTSVTCLQIFLLNKILPGSRRALLMQANSQEVCCYMVVLFVILMNCAKNRALTLSVKHRFIDVLFSKQQCLHTASTAFYSHRLL